MAEETLTLRLLAQVTQLGIKLDEAANDTRRFRDEVKRAQIEASASFRGLASATRRESTSVKTELASMAAAANASRVQMAAAFAGVGKQIGASVQGLKSSLFGLRSAFLALGAGVATRGIVSFASDFERSLANVSTLLDDTSVPIERYKQQLIDLSKASSKEIIDLTQGLYQAISAGIPATEGAGGAMDVLNASQRAAVAGLATTEEAVNAMVTVLNAYRGAGLTATQVSDKLFETVKLGRTTFPELASGLGNVATIAAEFGVSIDEVLASIAALTKAGLSTDEAITALRATISGVAGASAEARDALRDAGIAASISELQQRGLARTVGDVSKAMERNIDAVTTLFPNIRALKGVTVLAGSGFEDFNTILTKIQGSTGATDRAYQKIAVTFSETAAIFKSQVQAAFIEAGERVLPRLQGVIKRLGDFVVVNQDKLANAFAGFVEALVSIGEFVTRHGAAILTFLGAFFAAKLITRAALAVSEFTTALKAAAAAARAAAVVTGTEYAAGFTGAVKTLPAMISTLLKSPTAVGLVVGAAVVLGAAFAEAFTGEVGPVLRSAQEFAFGIKGTQQPGAAEQAPPPTPEAARLAGLSAAAADARKALAAGEARLRQEQAILAEYDNPLGYGGGPSRGEIAQREAIRYIERGIRALRVNVRDADAALAQEAKAWGDALTNTGRAGLARFVAAAKATVNEPAQRAVADAAARFVEQQVGWVGRSLQKGIDEFLSPGGKKRGGAAKSPHGDMMRSKMEMMIEGARGNLQEFIARTSVDQVSVTSELLAIAEKRLAVDTKLAETPVQRMAALDREREHQISTAAADIARSQARTAQAITKARADINDMIGMLPTMEEHAAAEAALQQRIIVIRQQGAAESEQILRESSDKIRLINQQIAEEAAAAAAQAVPDALKESVARAAEEMASLQQRFAEVGGVLGQALAGGFEGVVGKIAEGIFAPLGGGISSAIGRALGGGRGTSGATSVEQARQAGREAELRLLALQRAGASAEDIARQRDVVEAERERLKIVQAEVELAREGAVDGITLAEDRRSLERQILDDVRDGFDDFIAAIFGTVRNLDEVLQGIIENVIANAPAIVLALIEQSVLLGPRMAEAVVRGMFSGFQRLGERIRDAWVNMFVDLGDSFVDNVLEGARDFTAEILKGARRFIEELIDGIGRWLSGAPRSAGGAAKDFGSALIGDEDASTGARVGAAVVTGGGSEVVRLVRSIFHHGGMVGPGGRAPATAGAMARAGAPQFAFGGMVPSLNDLLAARRGADDIPALLQPEEGVLNRDRGVPAVGGPAGVALANSGIPPVAGGGGGMSVSLVANDNGVRALMSSLIGAVEVSANDPTGTVRRVLDRSQPGPPLMMRYVRGRT